ncbi:hypothetical protein [Thiobacillus denitrificans]|uniref:hypothetical protein n=1 Tax=Thiobacillus denitrificans TaxID=36861 RepID=UPI000A6F5447|nr:hypothetical protein [Thiobacillus denitrificans]
MSNDEGSNVVGPNGKLKDAEITDCPGGRHAGRSGMRKIGLIFARDQVMFRSAYAA